MTPKCAPTAYVRDRYIDWGIEAPRIIVEPQGMMPVQDRMPDVPEMYT